jgi:nitrate reductase delta subunit
MTEEARLRCKIASFLLQFPEEGFAETLHSVEEAARVLPPERPRRIFEEVIAGMQRTPLLELQEAYTRIFDLNPATSLNLTYHRWGNEKKRSEALVQLNSMYRDANYANASGELPDFLPMVLEFLAVAPAEGGAAVLETLGEEIRALAARLKETGTVYASLLEALDGIVPGAS